MTCISRPMPESLSSSCTSSRRTLSPLISYSLSPERYMRRVIDTSVYSIGRAPSELSMVSVTSARPRAGRPAVPAKMTSSILPPRRLLAPCSPRTQAMASTTLDFPEPLGPTTPTASGQRRLGVVARQAQQLVGDRGVTLGAQLLQFLLQPAHLGPQDGVLLDYSELRGCDDVTEQGLGHGDNGLSTA